MFLFTYIIFTFLTTSNMKTISFTSDGIWSNALNTTKSCKKMHLCTNDKKTWQPGQIEIVIEIINYNFNCLTSEVFIYLFSSTSTIYVI